MTIWKVIAKWTKGDDMDVLARSVAAQIIEKDMKRSETVGLLHYVETFTEMEDERVRRYFRQRTYEELDMLEGDY